MSDYVTSSQDETPEATDQPHHKLDDKSAPKLHIFTRAENEKDAPYEAWKYEVESLMREGVYSAHVMPLLPRSLCAENKLR